ncbi:antizyme inhibitor 1 [Esox lucius]|uniref:Orn/DAP/Arg decarboxylase 2 N-terminal domain-containing protein n=1 Tax=Esox lucius TaxID=8010 RepID=A0A3P8ZIZ5_ESOLU|nr:antizyme inhibitor 1 [Esox lucius]XP_010883496.2 antizyme inhibitor 1 [Esox lucius]
MKGLVDEPNYSVALLEGATSFSDVVDNYISEQTLVEKNAFFVADLGVIKRQHVRWRTHMPLMRPFYAVQANSSPAVIEILAALGTGFICTNKCELELVRGYGVSSEDIVYSGVCKQISQIKYAAKNGIDFLVCDNETELRKIARCHPRAKLLLQVFTEASGEGKEMGMAFGSKLKDCRHLLESAMELGMEVVGVRFHIPCSCDDPQAYNHAVSDARCVFDMGEDIGFSMTILDIGGGFSGSETQLKQINGAVRPLLELYFPASSGVSIMAEPGSYYVSSSFTLAVNIIEKQVVSPDRHVDQLHDGPSPNHEPEFLYYMNNGVYGSFASKLADNVIPAPAVHKSVRSEDPVFASSLWGPSGDELDLVVDCCLLPELSVGDWLIFSNAGAYSLGSQATFADISRPPVYYTISSTDWFEMQDAGITQDINMKNFSLVPYFLHSGQSDKAPSVPA